MYSVQVKYLYMYSMYVHKICTSARLCTSEVPFGKRLEVTQIQEVSSQCSTQGKCDPEGSQVSVKYLLGDVLSHHVGSVQGAKHFLDCHDARSYKLLNEKESKLNMFSFL